MSIRLIARDLYRLIREVEQLEKQISDAPLEVKPALEDRLRKLKAEREKLRRILEGSKETPLPKKYILWNIHIIRRL